MARIGEPVDRPWVGVETVLQPGVALTDVESGINTIVENELARLPEFRDRLGRGEYPVC